MLLLVLQFGVIIIGEFHFASLYAVLRSALYVSCYVRALRRLAVARIYVAGKLDCARSRFWTS